MAASSASPPPTPSGPPPDLEKRTLPLISRGGPWYRIHSASLGAIYFGKARKYRFDDPRQEYGVLYAGDDIECAFLETFGRVPQSQGRVSQAALQARSVSKLTCNRDLRFVNLTQEGLARLRTDASIFAVWDYAMPQEWSRAFHDHPDAPDGVYYHSRHNPSRFAIALFERVQSEIQSTMVAASMMEPAFAATLGPILDKYDFAVL